MFLLLYSNEYLAKVQKSIYKTVDKYWFSIDIVLPIVSGYPNRKRINIDYCTVIKKS